MASIDKATEMDLIGKAIEILEHYKSEGVIATNIEVKNGIKESRDFKGWSEFRHDGTISLTISLEDPKISKRWS